MASMFEQPRNGTLFLGGQKISGSDIRDQNGELFAAHITDNRDSRIMMLMVSSTGYASDRKCCQELLRP